MSFPLHTSDCLCRKCAAWDHGTPEFARFRKSSAPSQVTQEWAPREFGPMYRPTAWHSADRIDMWMNESERKPSVNVEFDTVWAHEVDHPVDPAVNPSWYEVSAERDGALPHKFRYIGHSGGTFARDRDGDLWYQDARSGRENRATKRQRDWVTGWANKSGDEVANSIAEMTKDEARAMMVRCKDAFNGMARAKDAAGMAKFGELMRVLRSRLHSDRSEAGKSSDWEGYPVKSDAELLEECKDEARRAWHQGYRLGRVTSELNILPPQVEEESPIWEEEDWEDFNGEDDRPADLYDTEYEPFA